MKIGLFLITLFIFSLTIKSNAKLFSEIAFNISRSKSGYYDLYRDGNWVTGGGISLVKNLGNDKICFFTGINYFPTAMGNSNQRAHYLQFPLELRSYFFKRLIFVEAGFDVRWLVNSNSEKWKNVEGSQYVKTYSPGYDIAFGVHHIINSNLFLNLKAFYSNGFPLEQRIAVVTNYGFLAEFAFAFK